MRKKGSLTADSRSITTQQSERAGLSDLMDEYHDSSEDARRALHEESLRRAYLFSRSGVDGPEGMLAAGVFCQAANDLQKFRYERRHTGQLLYREARDWVASNDRSWPYSFLNLCDALHLAPEIVRAELLGDDSSSRRITKKSAELALRSLKSRNRKCLPRTSRVPGGALGQSSGRKGD
jgi:hypothetical protein